MVTNVYLNIGLNLYNAFRVFTRSVVFCTIELQRNTYLKTMNIINEMINVTNDIEYPMTNKLLIWLRN